MGKTHSYVLAVAECKSISKAAEVLYISQPSLSKFISNLEKELGVNLFTRTNTGTELTEAGKVYVKYAKQIKSAEDKLLSEIKRINEPLPLKKKIGMSLNAATLSTSKVIQEVKKKYRGEDVEFNNILSVDIEKTLLARTYDFIIGPDVITDSRIEYGIIYREPYVLVVPERYDLQSYAVSRNGMNLYFIDLKQLPDLDFIFQEASTSIRKGIDRILNKLKIKITPCLQVANTMTALHAVQNNMGCCIAPLGDVAYLNKKECLSFYQIGDLYYLEGVAYVRGHDFSEVEKYCIRCIRKALWESEKNILKQLDRLNKIPHREDAAESYV